MKLTAAIHTLHPREVFRIARAERREVRNVFVKLEHDGLAGYGEASPNAYYHETAESVVAALERAAACLPTLPWEKWDKWDLWEAMWPHLMPSRAAQCALDLALWDWRAKRADVSVAELAWGKPPGPVTTFCTLGLSEPGELAAKVAELRGMPRLKLKSDATASLAALRAVRAQNAAAELALDANCAWSPGQIAAFREDNVLFLEQPLPPARDDEMPALLAAAALPIFADESCVTREDVERMPGRFSGFNIKLVKCGGLTPALAMARRGAALGLQTMVGCMLESSLLIAAGAVVAQHTDFADLDGAWLLRDDPFAGLRFERGVLHLDKTPGFGVAPARELFSV